MFYDTKCVADLLWKNILLDPKNAPQARGIKKNVPQAKIFV